MQLQSLKPGSSCHNPLLLLPDLQLPFATHFLTSHLINFTTSDLFDLQATFVAPSNVTEGGFLGIRSFKRKLLSNLVLFLNTMDNIYIVTGTTLKVQKKPLTTLVLVLP